MAATRQPKAAIEFRRAFPVPAKNVAMMAARVSLLLVPTASAHPGSAAMLLSSGSIVVRSALDWPHVSSHVMTAPPGENAKSRKRALKDKLTTMAPTGDLGSGWAES
eukprot:813322-Pyramimonas_sp.AAC.1